MSETSLFDNTVPVEEYDGQPPTEVYYIGRERIQVTPLDLDAVFETMDAEGLQSEV